MVNEPTASNPAPSGGAGWVAVVPTPIGNLADITLRAIDTLRRADLIACEDTRHTRVLLDHHDIRKPLVSFHEHNEAARTAELIAKARDGLGIALVSDAGTPGISDPGARLVHACHNHGIRLEVLPGPCAIPTALVGSGLPAATFRFEGFLPVKRGRRESALRQALESEEATTIFYESPHRLDGTLEMLAALDPDRLACVARELSKKFETFHRARAAELAAHYAKHPPRGEIVLIVAPRVLPKFLTNAPSAPE